MVSAAASLSVSTPPLVMELAPSKFIPPGPLQGQDPWLADTDVLPSLATVRLPSTNEPLEVVENGHPVVVLPSSVPLLVATSKDPLLVKVVPLPTISVPSASCTVPSLVTDAAVERVALSTIV